METEGFAAVSERVGGPGDDDGEGSVEEVLVVETECYWYNRGREEFEFPVHGEFRFGAEEEGIWWTGVGSRVALYDESGGFGGDEEEDFFAL